MLYAYVDESERDTSYYFLGAVICSDEGRAWLTRAIDAIMARQSQTFPALAGVELHGSTMMRAADEPWRSTPLRVRFRIIEQVFQAIVASGSAVYVEGVDIMGQLARGYPRIFPARELAFSHLFEKINGCCNMNEPRVCVIADEHHTADISRSNFTRYQAYGTYGYKSSKLPNIMPDITFIPSHTDRVLQAADLVTYIYNRLKTVAERDQRAATQKARLWAILDPATRWPRGGARIWP